MKHSLHIKLENLSDRHIELSALLSSPEVISDQQRFRALSKEYAQLEPIVASYKDYQSTCDEIEQAESLLTEDDLELKKMAEHEILDKRNKQHDLEQQLQILLLPRDPIDDHNVFLEIRAGTGGDEAAIFVGDLLRMYMRYAENLNWQTDIVNISEGEKGGYKQVVLRVIGNNVYEKLKFESGAHRVQRVPETESQGRIHTSACTVAVLPEITAVEHVDVNPNDLRIDTYRASGAGGQHVNKTDSAVRITHIPSGIVVECQDERSQHKNRARAMSLLQSKLLSEERKRQTQERAQMRRNLVGSGDRSERIRTYNYPQGRLTDHRINLTLYKLDQIMEGHLQQIIDPLLREHQTDLLSMLSEDE